MTPTGGADLYSVHEGTSPRPRCSRPPLPTAQTNQYEMQFGEPVDVSPQRPPEQPGVLSRPRRPHPRAARDGDGPPPSYRLRDTFGGYLIVTPINDISYMFEQEARKGFGKEFEITGVFRQRTPPSSTDGHPGSGRELRDRVLGLPRSARTRRREKAAQKAATVVRLEELVTPPGKYEGKIVRVAGQFRGENLFGDLPGKSRRKGCGLGHQGRRLRGLGHGPQAQGRRVLAGRVAQARHGQVDGGRGPGGHGGIGRVHPGRERRPGHRLPATRWWRRLRPRRRPPRGPRFPPSSCSRCPSTETARCPSDPLPGPVQQGHERGELPRARACSATRGRPSPETASSPPCG